VTLDEAQVVGGKITISGSSTIPNDLNISILNVEKDHSIWYSIPVDSNGRFNRDIYMIDGVGNYIITVMIHRDGINYYYGPQIRVYNSTNVDRFSVPRKYVESDNSMIRFYACWYVLWTFNSDAYRAAKTMYNWILNNMHYDYDKMKRVEDNPYDTIEESEYGSVYAITNRKGICFDFATLYAAFMQSIGVRTKVDIGYYMGEYHAWNECYIDGRWVWIDSTLQMFDVPDENKKLYDKREEY